MCGVSILLDSASSSELVPRLLAMHAVIPHRGPDGEGFLVVRENGDVMHAGQAGVLDRTMAARVGFAFRRLKICDLTEAASQPMASEDGRTWIVFNGEVYNFRELRRELEARGRVFRSRGDSEVVLAAYETWSDACFARLDGMWAIAVLDLRKNRLVVSRDRFGIKPLFWTVGADGAVFFASEIKQLLAGLGSTPASNRALISMYLQGRRFPALDETFFEGVRAVPAATWAEIDLSRPAAPRFRSYWNLSDFTAADNELPYGDAVERAEAALSAAVASHRYADVKVGALLSGGLDSSTLVALARRNGGGPDLPTYSLGFRDAAPAFCEMRYVDAMTRRDGIENYETTFDAPWVAANTDRVLWALEEPPLAMPAFAQFRLFELCAQHGATVILDGQGSDEITGGYAYHQRVFIRQQLLRKNLRAAFAELSAIARRDRRSSLALLADYFIWPRLQRRRRLEWAREAGTRANEPEFAMARSDYGRDPSDVNRQLYFDVRWGNVKIVLGYGDRNAMAHSVEARVPYFDRAFVELLFSLPDGFKIGNGDRKRILRDIARRYVPAEITERADRMGFGTPDEAMIRGPLLREITEAANDPVLRSSGWVDAAAATRFLRDFERGAERDYRAVWRIFALSRWARRFNVRN